jgi:hypothetical protein
MEGVIGKVVPDERVFDLLGHTRSFTKPRNACTHGNFFQFQKIIFHDDEASKVFVRHALILHVFIHSSRCTIRHVEIFRSWYLSGRCVEKGVDENGSYDE